MTEAEWLASRDPQALLGFLWKSYRHLSARKLRLFAVYCFRNVLHRETEAEVWQAMEVAERYAEGLATESELRAADEPLHRIWLDSWGNDSVPAAVLQMTSYAIAEPFRAAVCASWAARESAEHAVGTGNHEAEATLHASWLRDIFPSPFRPKYVTRDWFRWNGGTATILARQMYNSREFSAMPILADALQDAGCDNDDILSHCRDTQLAHVRGCWVVDLVLGKQ
jgi:hypothetical protein